MKKFFILAIVTILSIVNYSCSKDDNNNAQNADLIIGKWNGVSSTFNGTNSGVPDNTPITFTSDNRVSFTYLGQGNNGQDFNENGTWQKTGNTLKITWDSADPGLEVATFTITELTSSSLKWQSTVDGKILTENFSK
jgi:hypothetical protein